MGSSHWSSGPSSKRHLCSGCSLPRGLGSKQICLGDCRWETRRRGCQDDRQWLCQIFPLFPKDALFQCTFPLIHFSSDNADAPVYKEHCSVMQNYKKTCKMQCQPPTNDQQCMTVIAQRLGTYGLALPKIKRNVMIWGTEKCFKGFMEAAIRLTTRQTFAKSQYHAKP